MEQWLSSDLLGVESIRRGPRSPRGTQGWGGTGDVLHLHADLGDGYLGTHIRKSH